MLRFGAPADLPVQPGATWHAAVGPDRLHLVSADPVEHLAVGADGRVAVAPHPLELPRVQAAAVAGDELHLVCAHSRAGRSVPVLAVADASGELRGSRELPVGGALAQWPVPWSAGAAAGVAWAEDGSVRTASWDGEPIVLDRTDDVTGLTAAPGADAALICWWDPAGLHLRTVLGRGTWAADLPGPVAFARVARLPGSDGWLLLSTPDGRRGELRILDGGLRPGPVIEPAAPAAGERVRDLRLLPLGPGAAASALVELEVARARPGPVIGNAPVRRQARRHLVVALGPDGRPAGEAEESPVGLALAGWLGDRLLAFEEDGSLRSAALGPPA